MAQAEIVRKAEEAVDMARKQYDVGFPVADNFLVLRPTAAYFKKNRTEVFTRAIQVGYLQC